VNPLRAVVTLTRRGVLGPGLPHLQLGQLAALAGWGLGLAGELRQAAIRSADAVAVIDEDAGPVTYAALLARAEGVARELRARGLAPGDRLGLVAHNHVGAVAVMGGVALLGADLVLLNTGMAAEQVASVCAEQDLSALVHDEELAGSLASSRPRGGVALIAEPDLAAAAALAGPHTRLSPPPRVGRTVVLTSGTTGRPKGAARRNPAGVGPLVSVVDRIPVRARDTIHIAAPLFHTWGYAAFQLALAMRATVVLRRRFDPLTARAALVDESCAALFAVPVMLRRMLDLPPDPRGPIHELTPNLRVVATSGSALPAGLATRFMDEYGEVLYNLYGSTEASWVSIATPADLRRDPDTAGTPPRGTVVRIVDDDGRDVAPGRVGQILCGNDFTFEGYTSGSGGVEARRADALVDTGDLGHQRDGLVFVDGRADDMVVSGGENVYPAEVENLLQDHPAVREVAVCGIPDDEFGQRLAAFVVLEPGHTLTAEEVRDHVRAHRARHVVPREVVFVDALPRNATGKVLVRELCARYVGRA